MRTFVWIIGLLAILIALSASGALKGSVCIGNIGCVNSNSGSLSINREGTTTTGAGAPATQLRVVRRV